MLFCRNAEGAHGQKKVGNYCSKLWFACLILICGARSGIRSECGCWSQSRRLKLKFRLHSLVLIPFESFPNFPGHPIKV